MEPESDSDTNCNWLAQSSHERVGTGTGGLGNKRMSGDHPNYGLNIEKSPRDLRRFADT